MTYQSNVRRMKRMIGRLTAGIIAVGTVMCMLTLGCSPDSKRSGKQDKSNGIDAVCDGEFKYWNSDSEPLKRLKEFVTMVTDSTSDGYVPPCDRIAVFDIDGTLLCETAPTYVNFMAYCKRVLHDDTYTPTPEERDFVREVEQYIRQHHSLNSDWGMKTMDGQSKAFGGMTQQEYLDWFADFLATEPAEGFTGLKWCGAIYWPMIEAVNYLIANDFRVFVCSGTDRDLARALFKGVIDIPPYQFIASNVNYVPESQYKAGNTKELQISEGVVFDPDDRFVRGSSMCLNTGINKISSITREIARKPILAWGNSSGDYPMFSFSTTDNEYPSIAFCILCDDIEREYGNLEKAARTKSECDRNGWITVSMRDDWSTIYGPDVERTNAF